MHGQRSRLPVPKRIAEAPRGAGGSLIMPTWSAAGAPPSGVACLRTLRHTRLTLQRGSGSRPAAGPLPIRGERVK